MTADQINSPQAPSAKTTSPSKPSRATTLLIGVILGFCLMQMVTSIWNRIMDLQVAKSSEERVAQRFAVLTSVSEAYETGFPIDITQVNRNGTLDPYERFLVGKTNEDIKAYKHIPEAPIPTEQPEEFKAIAAHIDSARSRGNHEFLTSFVLSVIGQEYPNAFWSSRDAQRALGLRSLEQIRHERVCALRNPFQIFTSEYREECR